MANYVLLETIALTQSAASVTFDNLPTSGYTDLKIVASVRSTGSTGNYDPLLYRLNNSTSGYTARDVGGNGASAGSGSNTTLTSTAAGGTWGRILDYGIDQSTSTASTFSSLEMYIPNYLSSNNKSLSVDHVMENNATNAWMEMVAGLWSNTASITSISFALYYGSFATNSTFSLYGIAAFGTTPVLAPKATGGNIVANDGTYWYHAFTSSGYFVPQVGLTCDVLQIAGGGAGGISSAAGGGGGAGGVSYVANQSVTLTTAVTVGAGGSRGIGASGSYSYSTQPTNGNNSQFGALTAAVGGGQGQGFTISGNTNGGSGGGGYGGSGVGGTGTTGQGNNGGNGSTGAPYRSGGGGGAGAAGGNGNLGLAVGGIGTSTYSSWGVATGTGQLVSSTRYFAGGGGGSENSASGGAGGYGGGGAGAPGNKLPGTDGTANTGGGGGASANSEAVLTYGSYGGSGIVIIRYPIA